MSGPNITFPNAKAHPAGFRASAQLRCFALSVPSIRRKRHESVMRLFISKNEEESLK
jgi:hypothetical protein